MVASIKNSENDVIVFVAFRRSCVVTKGLNVYAKFVNVDFSAVDVSAPVYFN